MHKSLRKCCIQYILFTFSLPCAPRKLFLLASLCSVFDCQVNGDCVCASELPTAVLLELRAMLREQRVVSVSSSEAEVVKRSVDRCISVSHGCWLVKIYWSSLTVITSSTKSLDQALRWRAALTVLRNRAKARMSLGGCSHALLLGNLSRTFFLLWLFSTS